MAWSISDSQERESSKFSLWVCVAVLLAPLRAFSGVGGGRSNKEAKGHGL